MRGFVSCNHNGALPAGRKVTGVVLRLRPSKFDRNLGNLRVVVDMVRFQQRCRGSSFVRNSHLDSPPCAANDGADAAPCLLVPVSPFMAIHHLTLCAVVVAPHGAPCPRCVRVFGLPAPQSLQFGSSPLLMPSDWEARAEHENIGTVSFEDDRRGNRALTVRIRDNLVPVLARGLEQVQFRLRGVFADTGQPFLIEDDL